MLRLYTDIFRPKPLWLHPAPAVILLVATVCGALHPARLAPAALAQTVEVPDENSRKQRERSALKYIVKIRINDDQPEISDAIRTNSVLVHHQQRGALDIASLIARARADEKQLQAVLYEEARYGGSIAITIDGTPLNGVKLTRPDRPGARAITVVMSIKPGPAFRFGRVLIKQAQPNNADVSDRPGDYGLVSGEIARSGIVVSATGKIIRNWRRAGFPFARVHGKTITADHARQQLDVAITVASGAPAVYGKVVVTGTQKLKSRIIAEQSALQSGAPYNPDDLTETRKRLRKLDVVENVRIIEGKELDAQGGLPITIEVTERKPRYVGVTASVTTLDGGEVSAHWGHRNVFGGGEHLRVEGVLSQIGATPLDTLEFDASMTLTKPGVLDIDTSLFVQFRMQREVNDAFLSDTASSKIGLTRRYSPHLSGSLAIENRYIHEESETSIDNYTLLSFPGEVTHDTRDSRFDPGKGFNASARMAPVVDIEDAGTFLAGQFDVAGYWALNNSDRTILALRFQGGSILGGSLESVPSSYRFLTGGGNALRGYEYRSIGPIADGRVVSGLSFASSSLELRWRPMKQIGVVPFVDIATVSLDRVPKFTDSVNVGVGIGMRYYTMLGPIRIDTAVPLTNNEDRSKFSLYFGLGQAF